MCGICGFNFEDRKLVKEMADVLSHRGPDSDGIYIDKNISLGHKRLSIIDLSIKGKQPMVNQGGNLVIVYNGEIYNFKEIKAELEKKGYNFVSNTDTEVVLYAYEQYGPKCLGLFNGMFAFAIWNSTKKELFIARDRIGIKPLHYYFKDSKFLFASEIKAILQCKDVKRTINENCLKQLIYYAYPINGETMLEDIVELKPGHFLVLKDNKLITNTYWDLHVKETNKSEDFYVKKLTELLFASVKGRLIADVPLGVLLSGGIDSSVLVAIASKIKEEPIKTFAVGFDIPDAEFAAAKLVADHCGTDHREIHLDYKDYIKAMLKVLWHMEIPTSRPGMIPFYYLSNKIREYLTVSLSGEGGDELFAGYNRYDAYTKLPEKSFVEDTSYYESLKRKINMPLKEKIEYVASGVFNKDKEEFFTEETLRLPDNINVHNTFGPLIRNTKNDGSQLNKTLFYELKTEIPYFHCNKLDKTSMANSNEIRVPYLDHTVVEFAMTIPSKYKFYGREKKIILQKVAKPLLPKETVRRRKLPLVVPLTSFIEDEFISMANSLLSERILKKRSYYKIPRIKKLIEAIKARQTLEDKSRVTQDNAYRQLLFFTNLELWIKLFIENDNIKNPNLSIKAYL